MPTDDFANAQANLFFTTEWVLLTLRRTNDNIQFLFSRGEEFFAFAGALVGQNRVATHHQTFARKVFLIRDFRQIPLVEQRSRDVSSVHQAANSFSPQGRNPVEPLDIPQVFSDSCLGDHAAIAHKDNAFYTKALSYPINHASKGFRVRSITRQHFYRNRTTFPVTQ